MKILLIGGTGFIGPFVIRDLQQAGHSVTVLHRGTTVPPHGVAEIIGDRNHLADYRDALAREKFDLVIDFVLSSKRQAEQFMGTLREITGRVVVLSSMDAYRAWGVFTGMEPGGLEPLPVTEDSALRTAPPYPPEVIKRLQQMVSWADAEYDKVPVEGIVLGNATLPGTILRLPMIYGSGDYAHRFHPFLKRMDDARRFILFADDVAPVRTPRGYVEDVAAAIALAATSERAAGRTYNVCESQSFSELEWARKIAAAAGWEGEFVVLPRDKTPAHLIGPYKTAQHLVVSSARIREELGYREATPPAVAFQRTIAWERAHPPESVGVPFNYEAEDAALANLKATA
ncbi:MAG TPA: NAD-dependent epimerase/dehydratase family protein [Candidatus Angelobacter sp.]|nr:NAD-dependent epimerase/dehydratase family protein [Candidatus Angelobacter sp.]